MSNIRQKYVSLSIENKLKAIRRVEDGEKMKAVADSFNIKPNTLSTIMKQKKVLRAKLNENPASKKFKRLRTGKNDALDKAVATFISQARDQHIPVSGHLIQSKALQLGSMLNVGKFTASAGWLQRFKRRFGLKYRTLSGDAAEADKTVAIDWIQNVFLPLMSRYAEKDVFNADETGLFFKCLPNKTFAYKNDECKNGKHSKVRVTIMFCANMDGSEKIKPLVIGKSKKPRCFKNIKSLPVDYENNKKAWMTGYLFEKWLIELDKKFAAEKRNILFFVDNCTAHIKDVQLKLKAINLQFFPPNLTALLQPMDLGIIRTVKAHYRNALVLQLIDDIENGRPMKAVTLLDCINMVSKIWDNKVTSTIIKNCFRKAGFVDSNFDAEDELPIINYQEAAHNYEKLKAFLPEAITDKFEEYMDIDQEAMVGDVMTDEDIIESVQNNRDQETPDDNDEINNDDEAEHTTIKTVTKMEALGAINTLQLALEQKENVPFNFFKALNEMSEFLNK